jgi:uncharacterized membrane protein YdjX (TVP38/TMEM64 family)
MSDLPEPESPRPSRPISFPVLFAVLAVIVVAACLLFAEPFWLPIFQDPQKLRDWLSGTGPWAPVLYVFLQALQIVVFVLPGEVTQIAAGWVFGFVWGSVLSVIGAVIGSAAAFLIAHTFGVGLVHRIAGVKAVARFDGLMQSPKFVGSLFLLFLIPGIPKDILCYVAGLSRLKLVPFLVISTVARLPGILGSSLMGKALFHGDWWLLAGVAGGALVLFGVGWWFRDSIFALIERVAVQKTDKEAS